MTLHKDLTGADLHEPKGVATAVAGAVYKADGAGSGTWSTIVIPEGTFTMQHKIYTSAGTTTWTKPSDLMFVRVFLQGGGMGHNTGVAEGNGFISRFGSHVTATGGGDTLQSTGDINTTYAPYLPWAFYNANPAISVPDDDYAGNWAMRVVAASALGSSFNVVVGAGGSGTTANGLPGLVFVEEYIQI